MNNYEKIKSMSIEEMAEVLCQGIECVTYDTVDCGECCLRPERHDLCFYEIKNFYKEELIKWLQAESEE